MKSMNNTDFNGNNNTLEYRALMGISTIGISQVESVTLCDLNELFMRIMSVKLCPLKSDKQSNSAHTLEPLLDSAVR